MVWESLLQLVLSSFPSLQQLLLPALPDTFGENGEPSRGSAVLQFCQLCLVPCFGHVLKGTKWGAQRNRMIWKRVWHGWRSGRQLSYLSLDFHCSSTFFSFFYHNQPPLLWLSLCSFSSSAFSSPISAPMCTTDIPPLLTTLPPWTSKCNFY